MKSNYDYTLIDSRTGLSDIADICTVHLPDILVDCFTLNNQSIEGAAEIARVIDQRYHPEARGTSGRSARIHAPIDPRVAPTAARDRPAEHRRQGECYSDPPSQF